MDLYVWLASQRMSGNDLCKKLHYHPQSYYAIINGKTKPSMKFLTLVEMVTGGQVKGDDILILYTAGLKKRTERLCRKEQQV